MADPAAPAAHPAVPKAPPRAFWLCVGFVVLALALRLPLLGRAVWFDEACMSAQRIGTFEQLVAVLYVDIHPPLFVTFMHVWNQLFGDGEVALRLPALLSGLLAIPLTYWTGRWFVGDTAALWGALLLALSPVHIWYSAEARLYAPMVTGALVLAGTFERLTSDRPVRARLLWPLHIATVLALLFLHYYLAVLVVLLALLAPLAGRGFTPRVRGILAVHGLGLVLLGAFVAGKQALGRFETEQGYLRALDLPGLANFVLDWCWTGHTLRAVDHPIDQTGAMVQMVLGALLLGHGTIRLLRPTPGQYAGYCLPLLALAIPGFLLVAAWAGLGATYIERSAIAALPFLLLIAGAGLTRLPHRIYLVTSSAVLLLATASLVALYRHHDSAWTVYKPNSDWRSAAAWLGTEIDAGAAGRPVYTSTPNPRSLSYYDVRIQDVKNLSAATSPDRIGAAVEKRLGATVGDFARRTFAGFAAHNQALLAGAALRVYPSRSDPAALDLPQRGKDEICYLVRDEWHPHPSQDHTVEDLLVHPRVTVLAKVPFSGLTVYKIRIAP